MVDDGIGPLDVCSSQVPGLRACIRVMRAADLLAERGHAGAPWTPEHPDLGTQEVAGLWQFRGGCEIVSQVTEGDDCHSGAPPDASPAWMPPSPTIATGYYLITEQGSLQAARRLMENQWL